MGRAAFMEGRGGFDESLHRSHGVGELPAMKKMGAPGKVASKKAVTKAQTAPSAQPAATKTKTPGAASATAPAQAGMKKIGGPSAAPVKPKVGVGTKDQPSAGGGGAGAFGPSGLGTMHGMSSPMTFNHGTGGWDDHGVSESWIERHAKTRGVSNDRLEASLKASEGKPGRKREVLAGKLGKAVASRYRRAKG